MDINLTTAQNTLVYRDTIREHHKLTPNSAVYLREISDYITHQLQLGVDGQNAAKVLLSVYYYLQQVQTELTWENNSANPPK